MARLTGITSGAQKKYHRGITMSLDFPVVLSTLSVPTSGHMTTVRQAECFYMFVVLLKQNLEISD
jgi:hypothetical protein